MRSGEWKFSKRAQRWWIKKTVRVGIPCPALPARSNRALRRRAVSDSDDDVTDDEPPTSSMLAMAAAVHEEFPSTIQADWP